MNDNELKKYSEIQSDTYKDLINKYDILKRTVEKLEKIDKILSSELPDIEKLKKIKSEYNDIKITKNENGRN